MADAWPVGCNAGLGPYSSKLQRTRLLHLRQRAYRCQHLRRQFPIDLDQCDDATCAVIAEVAGEVLEIRDGKPALKVAPEEAASGRFGGWIACEIECRMRANSAVTVDLPIPGLDDLIEEVARGHSH